MIFVFLDAGRDSAEVNESLFSGFGQRESEKSV